MTKFVCRYRCISRWWLAHLRKSKSRGSSRRAQTGKKSPRSRHRGHRPALSTVARWRNEAGYFSKARRQRQSHHAERYGIRAGAPLGPSGHLPGRHGDDSRQCGGLGFDLHRRLRRSQHVGFVRSKRLDDIRRLARQVGGDDFGRRLWRNRHAQNRQRARHGNRQRHQAALPQRPAGRAVDFSCRQRRRLDRHPAADAKWRAAKVSR